MSFYERLAEGKDYFHFQRRTIYDTGTHFHGAIEFLFAETGTQEVTVGGEKRILQPGEACFSDSFCVHHYSHVPDSTGYILLGPKKYFDRLFAAYGDKAPPKFFRFEGFGLLKNLLNLCDLPYSDEKNRYGVFEGAAQILLSTIAESTPFVARNTEKQSALVCEILRFADENLTENLSLATLSRTFGYSREHLSRILNKYLSENWNTYLNRLRVRRADMLLRESPDASVFKIALDCGFESPNTFYRAYKKEFGSAPRKR